MKKKSIKILAIVAGLVVVVGATLAFTGSFEDLQGTFKGKSSKNVRSVTSSSTPPALTTTSSASSSTTVKSNPFTSSSSTKNTTKSSNSSTSLRTTQSLEIDFQGSTQQISCVNTSKWQTVADHTLDVEDAPLTLDSLYVKLSRSGSLNQYMANNYRFTLYSPSNNMIAQVTNNLSSSNGYDATQIVEFPSNTVLQDGEYSLKTEAGNIFMDGTTDGSVNLLNAIGTFDEGEATASTITTHPDKLTIPYGGSLITVTCS